MAEAPSEADAVVQAICNPYSWWLNKEGQGSNQAGNVLTHCFSQAASFGGEGWNSTGRVL